MIEPSEPKRGWSCKFANAIRGGFVGAGGQSSFVVHAIAAFLVVLAAAYFGVSGVEWCLLTLCIVGVIAAELFNSALEVMAKSITQEQNSYIRDALDIASGAVLIASMGATAIGLIIFVPRVAAMFL